ncbi:MAG: MFS transporter, partial [Acidimicrobiales bacterium]
MLGVLTLVAFITNLDATIVIIALPRLMQGLHTTATVGLWTLTGYIITSTVLLLPAGRWSDLVGGTSVFLAGLAVFAVATVACGFAGTGTELIVARLVQGCGAALALATATPLIVATFPSRQLGMALGINSTAWVLGSIVGPVVGGALVSTLGWRSVFFVAAPFAVVGIVVGAVVLPRGPRVPSSGGLDWTGTVTFGTSLVLLLLAFSEGEGWGWLSARTVGLFVVAAVLMALFCVWELRHRAPVFDLRLLRRHHYRWGLSVTAGFSVGFFATTFLLTFYLQGALRLSPLDAGLVLVPLSVPQLLLAPVGGSMADRLGPARLVVVGAAMLVVSGFFLGRQGTTLDPVRVVIPLLVMSAATSILWPSLLKAVMSALPADQTGVGSGLFYTVRNVGMSLSLTLALVLAEARLPRGTASRVLVGTAGALSHAARRELVGSTNAGFEIFVVFYLLALVSSLFLLRPAGEDGARPTGEPPAAGPALAGVHRSEVAGRAAGATAG